jgi:hypothetical protein
MYCTTQDRGGIFFIYVALSFEIGLRVVAYNADSFKLGMSLHSADRGQGHS